MALHRPQPTDTDGPPPPATNRHGRSRMTADNKLEIVMAQRQKKGNVEKDRDGRPIGLVDHSYEPLYAIPDPDDPAVIRFFSSDEDADAFYGPESVERALSLAGAWSDLDWDEVERELYRIGHSTPPSTPFSECDAFCSTPVPSARISSDGHRR